MKFDDPQKNGKYVLQSGLDISVSNWVSGTVYISWIALWPENLKGQLWWTVFPVGWWIVLLESHTCQAGLFADKSTLKLNEIYDWQTVSTS